MSLEIVDDYEINYQQYLKYIFYTLYYNSPSKLTVLELKEKIEYTYGAIVKKKLLKNLLRTLKKNKIYKTYLHCLKIHKTEYYSLHPSITDNDRIKFEEFIYCIMNQKTLQELLDLKDKNITIGDNIIDLKSITSINNNSTKSKEPIPKEITTKEEIVETPTNEEDITEEENIEEKQIETINVEEKQNIDNDIYENIPDEIKDLIRSDIKSIETTNIFSSLRPLYKAFLISCLFNHENGFHKDYFNKYMNVNFIAFKYLAVKSLLGCLFYIDKQDTYYIDDVSVIRYGRLKFNSNFVNHTPDIINLLFLRNNKYITITEEVLYCFSHNIDIVKIIEEKYNYNDILFSFIPKSRQDRPYKTCIKSMINLIQKIIESLKNININNKYKNTIIKLKNLLNRINQDYNKYCIEKEEIIEENKKDDSENNTSCILENNIKEVNIETIKNILDNIQTNNGVSIYIVANNINFENLTSNTKKEEDKQCLEK